MNKSPHIVLFNDDAEQGGVAIYAHALSCGLVRRGYRVTCVQTKTDNPMIELQRQLGVTHQWLRFDTRGSFERQTTNEADAVEVFDLAQPDVVLFANCDPFSHIAAKKAAARRGIPFVIVENYVWPFVQAPANLAPYLPVLAEQYRQAKVVVAVSHENLELLRRCFGLSPHAGQVIHYGRPNSYFTPPNLETRQRLRREFQIPADAVLSLTLGRLENVKCHQLIMEALKTLVDHPLWPSLYFVWLGGGSLEAKLRTSLEQARLTDHVKILGRRWDVVDWLDASDIFILPSRCEGMPLSIMEAMAKGLAVMASAVSGTPEELGDTGKLLTSPRDNPDGTVRDIAGTLVKWAGDPQLRKVVGDACRQRASVMFREERMIAETCAVLDRALLPAGDYVSPGFAIVRPDDCFPNMIAGDRNQCHWTFFRREVNHNWYVDKRAPHIGFVSRDEAHILYNSALRFRGKHGLEIGCWLGWSTCHLALGGVLLDVIDPVLADAEVLRSVRTSLQAAGVLESVNLVAGASPQEVEDLAQRENRRWSFFFIDGEHEYTGPVTDAAVCAQLAEPEALILFHDVAAPSVARGLEYLKYQGWQTMIYSTMQIMGVAWRGAVSPVMHRPDPDVDLPIPPHLSGMAVSGLK